MDTLKIYSVETSYIDYLRTNENLKHVYLNKEVDYKHGRKYLGVIIANNDFNYYVPLSSPKDSDFQEVDGKTQIRKSIVPIIRIVVNDINGNDELKGTLRISNMIPVPDSVVSLFVFEDEPDEDYRILVQKEYDFVKANKKYIVKNANIIYNQKTKEKEFYADNPSKKPNYLKNTLDFKCAEEMCRNHKA